MNENEPKIKTETIPDLADRISATVYSNNNRLEKIVSLLSTTLSGTDIIEEVPNEEKHSYGVKASLQNTLRELNQEQSNLLNTLEAYLAETLTPEFREKKSN